MLAYSDSDRAPAAVTPARFKGRAWRRWALCAVAIAVLMAGWGPVANAARARKDSTGMVRRISISDQGIEIERDEPGTPIRKRGGGVRISVDGTPGDVVIAGDTVDIGGRTVVGPGIVINGGESSMVRMFSDAEVHAGDRVDGDVVAIFGDVRVNGTVAGNAVAVFGSVRLAPGAKVEGDAVAVGGGLEQPPGAVVGGESVSLGFLPFHWGAPTAGMMLGLVFSLWLISLIFGWILMAVLPTRMLRIATTASQRTGGSLVLGLLSAPLFVIAFVLLLITVVGIPIAIVLPIFYIIAERVGQLALTYALGCRLLRRRMGEGGAFAPMLVGTSFVGMFFALGVILARSMGALRTVALFFDLLGFLLVIGLSVIGVGAFLLSRMGSRPREVEWPGMAHAPLAAGPVSAAPPPAPVAPPSG